MEQYANGMEHFLDELQRLDLLIEMLHISREPQAKTEDNRQDDWLSLQKQLNDLDSVLVHRINESIRNHIFLPLEYITYVFELSIFDRFCLFLCLAGEFDQSYKKWFAYFQDHQTSQISIELAQHLFRLGYPELAAEQPYPMFPSQKLFRYFLRPWEVDEESTGYNRYLILDYRMLRFLLGDQSFAKELEGIATLINPVTPPPEILWESEIQQDMLRYIIAIQDSPSSTSKHPLFVVQGPMGSGKLLHTQTLYYQLSIPLLVCDLRKVPAGSPAWLTVIKKVVREALLMGAGLCFRLPDDLLKNEKHPQEIQVLFESLQLFNGLVFFLTELEWSPAIGLERFHVLQIKLQVPPHAVRLQVWNDLSQSYPLSEDVDLNMMSEKFRYTIGQIQRSFEHAVQAAMMRGTPLDMKLLHQGCYAQIHHRMHKKAVQITPKYHWDDLILPLEQEEQLRNACNHIKFRSRVYVEWGFDEKLSYGKGLSMLFAGPPGTGKTMTAEVIANDLHLQLYRVDLSQIVSKYIGETEKNLHEIFAEAKTTNAILFFDEADALFGKRSEVKDAHDKHANMETAYLLQKMEEYQGISILATNFQQNMDEAYLRRLNFVIRFSLPGASYRKKIWQSMYPKKAPLASDLDFDFLAETFTMSGGSIKNIVLSSAFLAAEKGEPIGMKHIAQAAKHEMAKNGKTFPQKEFSEYL